MHAMSPDSWPGDKALFARYFLLELAMHETGHSPSVKEIRWVMGWTDLVIQITV